MKPKRGGQRGVITSEDGYFSLLSYQHWIRNNELILRYYGRPGTTPETSVHPLSTREIVRGDPIVVSPKFMQQLCDEVEAQGVDPAGQMVVLLDSLVTPPGRARAKWGRTALIGSGVISALAASTVLGAAGAGGPCCDPVPDSVRIDPLRINSVSESPVSYGRPYFLLFNHGTHQPGFNFVPTPFLNHATLWSPASLAFALERQITTHFDIERYVNANLFSSFGKGYAFSMGFNTLSDDQRRTVSFSDENGVVGSREVTLRLRESILNWAVSFSPNNRLAIGFAPKIVLQRIDVPSSLERITEFTEANASTSIIFERETTETQFFDLDVSVVYAPTPQIILGLSAISVIDRKLLDQNAKEIGTRALGLGASFQQASFYVGAEAFIDQVGGADTAVGVGYEATNFLFLSAGWAITANTFSAGTRLGFIDYRYINSEVLGETHSFGVAVAF